jgi:glycosyltransferase involved in cell wall biosynthesis
MSEKLKVLFATSDDPSISGCGLYRVLQPSLWLSHLFKDQMELMFTDILMEEDMYKQDIFYFTRQAKPDVVNYVERMKKETNKFVVLDFDDNVNVIPPHIPLAQKFYNENKSHLRRMMQLSDLFVFTHTYLAEQIINTNGIRKPYILLPNAVNTDYLKNHPDEEDNCVRIGWFGSYTHKYDLAVIRGLLEEVHKRLNGQKKIKLFTIGPPKEFISEFLLISNNPPFEWEHLYWKPTIKYLETILDLKIHIGLAPLEDTYFNRCKSNLKMLEYVWCGAVPLASDVHPYSETFTAYKQYTHCENKFKDWVSKLITLIMNSDLRKQIHNELKKELSEKWSCKVVYQKFGEELLSFYYQWLKNQ